MSVDPLKLDNPLNQESVSRDDFPIQFPARHEFDAMTVLRSGMILVGVTLTCVMLTYLFAHAFSGPASVVAGVSRLMVMILMVAVVTRWESRSTVAFYATVVVAALGLFTTTTLMFIGAGNLALISICSLTMLTLLWTAAEIAIHFQSIDLEIMRRDPAIADQRRQENTSVLQFFAVVMGIAQCLALWTSMRVVVVPIAAVMGAAISFAIVAEFAKYPARFLRLTIEHYLGYPASNLLAPGLIRSSAPHPLFRLFPFVLVVMQSAVIVVANHGVANALVGSLLMALCGILAGLAALLLGASLTARPIHFEVDRTPFDVVISKLRPKKNKNA